MIITIDVLEHGLTSLIRNTIHDLGLIQQASMKCINDFCQMLNFKINLMIILEYT